MQLITFLHEFIKHPKHTGAITPSSKILAKKMVDIINFNSAKCIVELGPGTGVFTKEIMKRKKKETIFLLIEINEVFCKELKRKFKDEKNDMYIVQNVMRKLEEENLLLFVRNVI
jgi:phospholipid N-methyltransferase